MSEQNTAAKRLPQTPWSRSIDGLIRAIGSGVSWVWVILVVVVITNVTLRYVFGQGAVPLEEAQWHLYAVGFMVGLAYCLESDDHVRIDVLYEKMSLTTQAWVEFYGLLLLLFPLLLVVLIYAIPFIGYSFTINESSEAPGGLPYRWAIKAVLFIGFGLLLLAAFSRLLRVCAHLFGVPRPSKER